ncbi:hypothetical protein GCM10028778_07340 [Barrientosiimonas marina]|uniref:C40 family peptidase n=1 Tax=Lentibacillus kimchii TaxID=1542911 RepID=A0ABW2UUL6_9BACI
MAMKLTVKKGTVSALLATSVAFSPLMAGTVSAHGAPDAAGSSEGAAGVAVMDQGEQGQEITNLQQQLQNHGYNVSTDGIYGPNVEAKVIRFQNDQGWDADGVVDAPTLNALDSDAATHQPETMQIKSQTVNNDSVSNDQAVSTARNLVGTSYVTGGTTPEEGFDSSGFIDYVFQQQGIDLSRTHAQMWSSDKGQNVDNPQPGDVIFFENTYKDGVSHSGIYIGNDKMIHAGTEDTGVEVTSLTIDYWQDKYIGAKRF